MNFYDIFENIQIKLLKESSEKTADVISSYIKRDINLKKQYYIFESILNLKEIESKKIIDSISTLENYCKNLNYQELSESNKKLSEHFNVLVKNKKPIHESIDNLIRYNSGGVYDLSKGLSYRKEILNYVVENYQDKEEIIEFKHLDKKLISKIINKRFNEEYESLNQKEKIIFDILSKKKYEILEKKINLIEKKKLNSNLEKELITESLVILKEKLKNKNTNFENLTFEIISLEESLIREGKFGPGTEKKVPNLDLIQNINVSCSENKNKPEQIIIDFDFFINLKSDNYKSQVDEIKNFEKKYYAGAKSLLKSSLSNSKYFKSDDFIFDGSVPINGLTKNKPVRITGEIYLETKNDSETDSKSFDEFLKPSVDFMISFENNFKKKFKEELNEN